jgi:16S rRNA G966 N2-methylase RsmD
MDRLRPELGGAKILDLFAGNGRFGLAAIKEGADCVDFVEKSSLQCMELKKSLASPSFKALSTKCRLIHHDVFLFLDTCESRFDIIFADPPFALWNEDFSKKILPLLARVANENACVVIKMPKRFQLQYQQYGFRHEHQSIFGESALLYLELR